MTNTLYYGDNLDVLRKYVPDESVDLIYLDPPFNSNRAYNVLFKERSGEASPLQIITVEELLAGKKPDLPPARQTFQQAPIIGEGVTQHEFVFGGAEQGGSDRD